MKTIGTTLTIAVLFLASGVTGALGMKWWSSRPHPQATSLDHIEAQLAEDRDPGDAVPTVPTVRPRRDPSLAVSVQGFATVEAFFQADLRARASGIVKAIPIDLGDTVRQGDLLLEIDVPDLVLDVVQRESLIEQRRQEERVAESKVVDAEAALDVAKVNVRQKQTEVEAAIATAQFRGKRFERFSALAKREAVTPEVVEEQERDKLSAEAAAAGAKVAVEKAIADQRERESAVGTAKAEVRLRRAMVQVAEKDLERARALADYARIRAPFDGIVTRRSIDPGDFVQNATTGSSETLISLARTDIVTVVTRLPENVAPFLTRQTEATMEFDELPGAVFAARVTRFAPAVQTNDRTVRVEVDLYNAGQRNFEKFATRSVLAHLAATGGVTPLSRLILNVAIEHATRNDHKGITDQLPTMPILVGTTSREPHLLPGMVGTMHLQLRRFADAFVVPATAIFTRGGKTYLLEVREGVAQLLPVQVQVNDGTIAKVAVVARVPDGKGGQRDVLRELTGKEELVASRQQELTPGKPVKTAPTQW